MNVQDRSKTEIAWRHDLETARLQPVKEVLNPCRLFQDLLQCAPAQERTGFMTLTGWRKDDSHGDPGWSEERSLANICAKN